jgi:hypothetical protein
MIRDGNSPITFNLGTSDEFRGDQFSVAEYRMCVEIYHDMSPHPQASFPRRRESRSFMDSFSPGMTIVFIFYVDKHILLSEVMQLPDL